MKRYLAKVLVAGSVAAILGAGLPGFAGSAFQGAATVQEQEISTAERDLWNRVASEIDLKRKAQAAENYLKLFPEGRFVPYAHEIIAVTAHQNSNLNLFFHHAELAVEGLPNEVSLMSSLSAAYAERQEAEPAIRHGEAVLAILPTMERPQEYPEEIWPRRRDRFMADAHYGAGTGYLFKAFQAGSGSPLMARSLDHLVKASELTPQDEKVHFRLGFAWQVSGELEKAVLEYARAVALEGANSLLARQYLEKSYESLHGNQRNLDKLVSEQKKYLMDLAGGGN